MTDSPGLNDGNIPLSQWLNIYNKSFHAHNKKVDLVILIIQKRERVEAGDIQVFTVLDTIIGRISAKNVAVIVNRCTPDDDIEDVLGLYRDVYKQVAKPKNLPNLSEKDTA